MTNGIVKNLQALAPSSNGMPSVVIAVDGRGGSGKTTFARQLALELGAQLVHTDSFASWENKFDWWPNLIEKVLEPIRAGSKSLSYPCSVWDENKPAKHVVEQAVEPIVILEGVSSGREELRDYVSFVVYVDMSLEECFLRRIARANAEMFYPDLSDEEKNDLWNAWVKEENIYLGKENPSGRADVVIDGHLDFGQQLELFKAAVACRLLERPQGGSDCEIAI